LAADTATAGRAADEIDIACCATVAYSSEDPAHPVENLLDGQSGPGGTRWLSARPDTAEHILVEFDEPQAISRLVYEVEETRRERTQEVRVEASDDGGRTYRQILCRRDYRARDEQHATGPAPSRRRVVSGQRSTAIDLGASSWRMVTWLSLSDRF
jgi:hypothetical protein